MQCNVNFKTIKVGFFWKVLKGARKVLRSANFVRTFTPQNPPGKRFPPLKYMKMTKTKVSPKPFCQAFTPPPHAEKEIPK